MNLSELVDFPVNLLRAFNSDYIIRVLRNALSRNPGKCAAAFHDFVYRQRQLKHFKQIDGLASWVLVTVLDVVNNVRVVKV